MATQTSLIAQQVRIRQWAEQNQRSSVSLSRYSIMLNDADASGFKKVYLAMGFTDLRRGIDG